MAYIAYQNPQFEIVAGLFLDVDVSSRMSNESSSILLKIDTGSARTVLPISFIVNQLRYSKPFYHTECTSYDGTKRKQPVFLLDLELYGIHLHQLEVIGVKKNTLYGLLGRDVLRHFFLRCDGPNEQFELEYVPK